MIFSQQISSVFREIMWHLVICRAPLVERRLSKTPLSEVSALNMALDVVDVGLKTLSTGMTKDWMSSSSGLPSCRNIRLLMLSLCS